MIPINEPTMRHSLIMNSFRLICVFNFPSFSPTSNHHDLLQPAACVLHRRSARPLRRRGNPGRMRRTNLESVRSFRPPFSARRLFQVFAHRLNHPAFLIPAVIAMPGQGLQCLHRVNSIEHGSNGFKVGVHCEPFCGEVRPRPFSLRLYLFPTLRLIGKFFLVGRPSYPHGTGPIYTRD